MGTVKKKMITIYDIAQKTGFSAATVSRVLNDKAHISEGTREKIFSVARQLQYSPNIAARTLKTGSSKQIMLSIPHFASTYYVDLVESVQRQALLKGYSLLLYHTHASEWEELHMLENLKNNYVDGLILISVNITEKHMEAIKQIHCPLVLSGICKNHLDDQYRHLYDYVGVDTQKGIFLSTEHLIRLGHKKIAYIGLAKETQTGCERYTGFTEALDKWGLHINKANIVFGGYTIDFGYRAGKYLLEQNDIPTAIVTSCDHICMGLYRILEERGYRVADDIAVVGMDDIEFCSVIKPGLSTVQIASSEIGHMAGDIMVKRLEGWEKEKQNIIFEPKLIVRDSSRKLYGRGEEK